MKIYLILFFLFYSGILLSQNNDTIYLTKGIPVKNGYFLKSRDSIFSYKAFKNPISGILIYSSNNQTDMIYSLNSGKVKSIIKQEDGTSICLIKDNDLIYAYGNLDSVFFKPGSVISKVSPIGRISSTGSTPFLHLLISKVNHKYLTYDIHIKEIREANQ